MIPLSKLKPNSLSSRINKGPSKSTINSLSGAALAIAHHPHVTKGLELENIKLITYSKGNIIFEQSFSATQHSFILYVWLDGEKFHRTEIVPIFVKGYEPTQASGMHRHTVIKALKHFLKFVKPKWDGRWSWYFYCS